MVSRYPSDIPSDRSIDRNIVSDVEGIDRMNETSRKDHFHFSITTRAGLQMFCVSTVPVKPELLCGFCSTQRGICYCEWNKTRQKLSYHHWGNKYGKMLRKSRIESFKGTNHWWWKLLSWSQMNGLTKISNLSRCDILTAAEFYQRLARADELIWGSNNCRLQKGHLSTSHARKVNIITGFRPWILCLWVLISF